MLVINYYKILGVHKNATQATIKTQYRALVKKYHPDVHQNQNFAEEQIKLINEAYFHLGNASRRRAYDLKFQLEQAQEITNTTDRKSKKRGRKRPVSYKPPTKEQLKKQKHQEYLSFMLFVLGIILFVGLFVGFMEKNSLKFKRPYYHIKVDDTYYIYDENKNLLYELNEEEFEKRF